MTAHFSRGARCLGLAAAAGLVACANTAGPASPAGESAPAVVSPLSATRPAPGAASTPSPPAAVNLVAPAPVRFEESIARAGQSLFAQAASVLGSEARVLVVDPLIDANTGAQTVSTVKMGEQLESLAKSRNAKWSVKPLTRDALAQKPLLLIGTLTPVTVGGRSTRCRMPFASG